MVSQTEPCFTKGGQEEELSAFSVSFHPLLSQRKQLRLSTASPLLTIKVKNNNNH